MKAIQRKSSGIVVFGAQWGDEGKGKLVDLLARDCQYIVRYQGGNNAGHTVIVGEEKHVLQLIPSGILHENTICCLGNGVVLDPFVFCVETDALKARGVDVGPARLKISPKTHLILPYHVALDNAREQAKSEGKIGTTGRGIGPCYEDKAARIGIRAGDLTKPATLKDKIENALLEKNALLAGLYKMQPMNATVIYDELMKVAPRIISHLADISTELEEAFANNKTVMFEGAQGTHLDIDHGTYPFVTSSNTIAPNAAVGTGVGSLRLERIIGIVKAYTTRVGSGPFATELFDETGEFLRKNGFEFGTVTGRSRRCGWFDAVVVREAGRLGSMTEIALTKLDVLTGLPELKLCVAYECGGKRYDCPPQGEFSMADVTPVYESIPGWSEDITGCLTWESLPQAVRNYIERIEALTGTPVKMISVGPERDQTIIR